jgi:hypothetical protein
MADVSKRFKSSFSLCHQLWRVQLTPLLILMAIGSALGIEFEDYLNELSKTQETERWMVQLGMGIWDLLEGILLILVLSWGIPKVRVLTEAHFEKHPFAESYLGSFLAEYLRALANVLLFGLLLLLPGFYKYCRLIFVPYITLFAKPYRAGKMDALALSADLTRGRFLRLLGVLVATIAIQVALEFSPQMSEILHSLPFRILSDLINFYISVWLFAYLYLEFEDAMEKYDWRTLNGSNV